MSDYEMESDSDSSFEMTNEEYVKYCLDNVSRVLYEESDKKEFREELFRMTTIPSYDGTIKSYFSDTFWNFDDKKKVCVLIIFNNHPEETISKYKTGFLSLYYFSKIANTEKSIKTLSEKIDNWNNAKGVEPISVEMLMNMSEEEAFVFCDNITV